MLVCRYGQCLCIEPCWTALSSTRSRSKQSNRNGFTRFLARESINKSRVIVALHLNEIHIPSIVSWLKVICRCDSVVLSHGQARRWKRKVGAKRPNITISSRPKSDGKIKRQYGKHFTTAFYSNASCYRADARHTIGRALYSNESCYRAETKNTNDHA